MVQPRSVGHRDFRRPLERLDGLPLRPVTARWVLDRAAEGGDAGAVRPAVTAWKSEPEIDPGWVLARARASAAVDPLSIVHDRPWWPSCSRAAVEALTWLWHHALAVGLAALRLAREASDPDPDQVAQAGMLHGLGLWAIAAVEPEWLVGWQSIGDRQERRQFEHASLGVEASTLGRMLAERWGLDRLTADAAWLHAERGEWNPGGTPEAARLHHIQAAYALAGETPWAPGAAGSRELLADPRLKILVAEVQARCRGAFIEPESPAREERLTRENARLRLTVASLAAAQASRDRFLEALAGSDPAESTESWAEHAGLAWCGEPGVSAARVEWSGASDPQEPIAQPGRDPTVVLPLRSGQRTVATLRLWTESAEGQEIPALVSTLPAWRAWAVAVDHRARLEQRLEGAGATLRDHAGNEELHFRKAKLDALAEFAAGAGHELNNPLAVIVGRAQLLLGREDDPHTVRSLRAILTQAQRAHRILRDLMYVARPPDPRPRLCQPDEIWRSCLRDARIDAEERGVFLTCDGLDQGTRAWADPDGLRHAADALLRNAIEATPRGGSVRVASVGNATTLRWSVHDGGRGITQAEGAHLFDPFYCGRQAGRGLGMGLPRVARFLELSGGEIRWQTVPGQGSSFQVRIPLVAPPDPPLFPIGSAIEPAGRPPPDNQAVTAPRII